MIYILNTFTYDQKDLKLQKLHAFQVYCLISTISNECYWDYTFAILLYLLWCPKLKYVVYKTIWYRIYRYQIHVWFHGVVVITRASHARGRGFETRWNLHFKERLSFNDYLYCLTWLCFKHYMWQNHKIHCNLAQAKSQVGNDQSHHNTNIHFDRRVALKVNEKV